jgi:hypothetical protein
MRAFAPLGAQASHYDDDDDDGAWSCFVRCCRVGVAGVKKFFTE